MKNVQMLEWQKDPVLVKYGLKVEPNMIQVCFRCPFHCLTLTLTDECTDP